jgi:hypothetical protein
VKKSQSYARKFHPFPLIAFAYYLASGSWPSANTAALHRNDKDKKSVLGITAFCLLCRVLASCFTTYQVLSSVAHWIQSKSALKEITESRKLISALGFLNS